MTTFCPTCGHTSPAPRVLDRCISCNTELKLVFDDPEDCSQQYENALDITLSGGYGMFFDSSDHHVFLCHDCAHTLCEQVPWLAELIAPQHSHAHRAQYWTDHPDHEGWDKKGELNGK